MPEWAGRMESLTEPVTDTSDSELEEGELPSDEIEIISEFIRQPSVKPVPETVIAPSPLKRPSAGRRSDVSLNHSSKRPKLTATGRFPNGNAPSRSDSAARKASRLAKKSSKETTRSRSPAAANSPTRNPVQTRQPKPPLKPQSGRNQSNQLGSLANPPLKSDQRRSPTHSSSVTKTVSKEQNSRSKWIPSFETLTQESVDMELETGSSSDDDEEMELRLAALNSVVSNVRLKDLSEAEDPSSPPAPADVDSGPTGDIQEDDDDEELLRAQLLIEVARKQTKDLETSASPSTDPVAPVVEPASAIPAVPKPPAAPLLRHQHKQSATSIIVPVADRLIINLCDDSSDSSDEEDGSVGDSITALLKSARQSVEQNDDNLMPKAMSVLPRTQQEEYQRLKQEIARRQNRLQQQQGAVKAATLTQSQLDNILKENVAETKSAAMEETINPPSVPAAIDTAESALDPMQTPAASTTIAGRAPKTRPAGTIVLTLTKPESESSAKENQQKRRAVLAAGSKAGQPPPVRAASAITTATTNLASPSNTKPAQVSSKSANNPLISPSKQAALRQQLSAKRKELASTKDGLKAQLELVDKNRSLWMKSSQEVGRLKALLQAAEETEKQMLNQWTSSQENTQRLKTKMQTVERQIDVLLKGLNLRPRRVSNTSAKVRSKTMPQQPRGASAASFFVTPSTSAANFSATPATPFRVKPKVFARALATNKHLKYVRSQTTIGAASIDGVELGHPKQPGTLKATPKRPVHGEHWLYGILGDDLGESSATSGFPDWCPNEQTTALFSNEKFRIDPSRFVCRHHLDSKTCVDKDCRDQHLPPIEDS